MLVKQSAVLLLASQPSALCFLFHYSASGFCNIHDVMNLLTLIWFVYYLVTMYFIITYVGTWLCMQLCICTYVCELVFSIRYL